MKIEIYSYEKVFKLNTHPLSMITIKVKIMNELGEREFISHVFQKEMTKYKISTALVKKIINKRRGDPDSVYRLRFHKHPLRLIYSGEV